MAKPLPKSKRPAPIQIATDFIIRLVGVSPVQSKKAGPFRFNRVHNALIFEGREIPIQDFNAIVPEVLNRYNGTYSHRLPEVVLLDRSGASDSIPTDSPDPSPVVFGAVSDEQGTAQDTEPSEQASESAPEGEVPDQDSPTEEITEETATEAAPEESDPSDAPAEETPAPAEETPATEPPAEEPPTEDPAPAPKKGGRPPKYGKGGQPVKK